MTDHGDEARPTFTILILTVCLWYIMIREEAK